MLLDAREVPNSKVIQTDVCIVGAGAAGITIALEFANTSVNLCLLESGGFEFEEETQSLYEGEIRGRPDDELVTTRLRYFGGTTNHWLGWCRPLDAIDFEKRSYISSSGWPITREDLDPYYLKATKFCELQSTSFEPVDHLEEIPQFFSEHLGEGRTTTRIYNMSPPTRFGMKYQDTIVKAENINTFLHANVVEIETNDGGTTVDQLRIATLDGARFWVKAKLYILAVGGVEGARLLLVSPSKTGRGVGNDYDQVGRFFLLHPHVEVGRVLLSGSSGALFVPKSGKFSFRSPVRFGLSVSEERQRAEGLPNHVVHFKSVEETPESVKALKRLFKGEDEDISGDLRHVLSDLGPIFDRIYERIGGKDVPDILRVELIMDHAPNPNSRIMLSSRQDTLGMPLPVLDWRLKPEEKLAARRTVEIIGEVLGAQNIGRMQLAETLLDDEVLSPENNAFYHHMGGTRMSQDPQTGVVDQNCGVHGVSNLFIAGSSVFPTSGFSNPTLTIVALAIRLADHLKKVVA